MKVLFQKTFSYTQLIYTVYFCNKLNVIIANTKNWQLYNVSSFIKMPVAYCNRINYILNNIFALILDLLYSYSY